MSELKQTRGYAQLRGVIGNLDKIKKDLLEGKSNKNLIDTETIKKLSFSVKTSKDNVIFVEIKQFKTGNAMQFAYVSKRDEETGKYQTNKINFSDRHRQLNDGWRLIGVSLKGKDDDVVKNLVPYDAIDYILENFEDGDGVFVNAEIAHSDNGDRQYTNYEVKKMFVTRDEKGQYKPIDFDAEDFEEQAEFSDELIYDSSYPSERGLEITAKYVNYDKTLHDVSLVVKNNTGCDEISEYVEQNFKRGDLVTFGGIINNRVEYEEVVIDEEVEAEPQSNVLGKKTKSMQRSTRKNTQRQIKSEDRSLQITALDLDKIKQGFYSDADLDGETSDLPF